MQQAHYIFLGLINSLHMNYFIDKKLLIFLPKFKHFGRGWVYRNSISVQQSNKKIRALQGSVWHPPLCVPASILHSCGRHCSSQWSTEQQERRVLAIFKCQLFSWATGPVLSLSLVTFWLVLSPWMVRKGLVVAVWSGGAWAPARRLLMGICVGPGSCSCWSSGGWCCCCISWYRKAWCCSGVSCWEFNSCWNCCCWINICLCWSDSSPSPEALKNHHSLTFYCNLLRGMSKAASSLGC